MKFDIYGRLQLEIEREGDRWAAYERSEGKRLRAQGVIIPDEIPVDELAAFLDDLFHEMGGPGDRVTRVDE